MLDIWRPQEDEQVMVDPRTKSRTIHTGLHYPDGSQGFIIIGRIGNTEWEPLKVIKQVIVEYVEEPEIIVAAEGDRVHNGEDSGGEPGNGVETNGVGQGGSVPVRKGRSRAKKGGENSGANVGA